MNLVAITFVWWTESFLLQRFGLCLNVLTNGNVSFCCIFVEITQAVRTLNVWVKRTSRYDRWNMDLAGCTRIFVYYVYWIGISLEWHIFMGFAFFIMIIKTSVRKCLNERMRFSHKIMRFSFRIIKTYILHRFMLWSFSFCVRPFLECDSFLNICYFL